jgi:Ser/Thr protein kinase RdoA (MazF antagonist)
MWQVFRRPDDAADLRAALRSHFPDEEAARMIAAYRAAGPLTDAEVASLARLADADRSPLLRRRFPGLDAGTAAATDFERRRCAPPSGRPGEAGCRQFIGDDV